jgi:hypothetical protein
VYVSAIDSSGNIETICRASTFKVGDQISLVFRVLDDSEPPYTVRIKAPDGEIIVERVLRDVPTGRPQSAPPVSFVAGVEGEYKVEIWQLYGKSRGQALMTVDPA